VHVGFGSILLVVSATALSLLYLVLGFYLFCDGNIKRQNLALSIIAGIFLCLAPQAAVFKILYWSDANIQLIVSLVATLIILISVLVLKRKAPEELRNYYHDMQARTIFLFLLCFILLITPTRTLIHIEYWDNPEFADIATNYYEHPNDTVYKKQYNDYRATHTPGGKPAKLK